MFNFFDKVKNKNIEDPITKIAALLIHVAKIDESYTEKEREIMEATWMQVKGACETLKEETNAQNEHIRKMLQEMSDRYYL